MITKEETAQKIADLHYRVEGGMQNIFRIRRKDIERELYPLEPVKLLEVNDDTIAAGIMPLGFDAIPGSGIDYPSFIVEITPEEFVDIQNDKLKLPEEWVLGEHLPRPFSAVGA